MLLSADMLPLSVLIYQENTHTNTAHKSHKHRLRDQRSYIQQVNLVYYARMLNPHVMHSVIPLLYPFIDCYAQS